MTVHPEIGMRTPMSHTTYDAEARKTWQDPAILAPAFVALAATTDPGVSGKRFNAYEVTQHLSQAPVLDNATWNSPY